MGGGLARERRPPPRSTPAGRALGAAALRRALPRPRPNLRPGGQRARARNRGAPARRRGRALASTVLRRSAVHAEQGANWPAAFGESFARGGERPRLQWCAGAPGILACAASYLDDELLLAAAETIWRAGPHGDEKGSGICHGTAGNGYALLRTFTETGDARWLERARAFAVHALEQTARLREARGRGRYSLFTGDVGAALFAADCLDARFRYPIFHGWE